MLIKLLIGSLVVLVVLFIALIWLVADLMHISLLLPAGVTAFFVLAAVSIVLFRKVRASGAARGLEGALAAQAKAQAKLVRPDLQVEVQHMQGEFDKAVAALKSAKLGPGGSNALYFLPWYAIIGPPGAGKSTALRSSGLHFPYTSGSGGASVKGLGGTRNCDWWLTNEAVVLDTAGRWSTQDEDHDEWLSFLGLLKRYRPRKPLNGLIAAISVGDVVNAREDDVEALAQRMRARLDEVQTQLRVSIPVYVLFTKVDLVEGFLETFGDLRRGDRNQVWGFTIPLSERTGDIGAAFVASFDQLADVLERRSLARMADERSLERRGLTYAFPQQFSALRRNLEKFINVMFQANVYQAAPCLRGVYFTSGTQEGRPFNLLMNRLVEAMGIRRKAEASETAVDQKSYFLHDVFMKVIFEDRNVASASDAELKRQRWRRIGLTSALGLVSLTVGLVPGYAWSLNKYQLVRLESAVEEWAAPEQKNLDEKQKLARLEPLRERVDTLIGYERDGAPLPMRMGMYQADQLVGPLRRYYANLLRRELVQPLVSHDLQAMSDFGLRYASLPAAQQPGEDEQHEFYERLKLHLLLTQPKGRGEPPFEASSAWVNDQLQTRWLKSAGDDPRLQEAARVNARLYLSFSQEFADLAFARDSEVVKRVREALNRVATTERTLNRLISMAAKDGSDITLVQLIGSTDAIRETRKVRAAFTRQGFESVVRDALTVQILEDAGELWVLGLSENAEQAKEQREAQLRVLRTAYFTAYIAEWSEYLKGLRVQSATDHVAALTLMQELTRVPPPLRMLFEKLRYQVSLAPKPTAGAALEKFTGTLLDKAKGMISGILGGDTAQNARRTIAQSDPNQKNGPRLGEADVGRAFEELYAFGVAPPAAEGTAPVAVPLDEYQEQLQFVRNALQVYVDNPTESEQLQARLQDARVRVRGLIERQRLGLRPLFESLLWPPVSGASDSVGKAIGDSLAETWCNEVVTEYTRTIAGRYPFDRNGQDLALADFSNFYRPKQGRLWSVVEGRFATTVAVEGDRYSFSKRLGKDGGRLFSPSLLEFLARSRDIMLSYFPTGQSEPSIEFEVKVQPSPSVAMTQFMVGGRSVDHYNGPEQWKTLTWPGENPAAGAAILIRGANGMQERIKQDGPWGLMRLLEAGTLRTGAGRTFTVAWQPQTHDVTLQIDFRPKRGESPFLGVLGRTEQPVLLQPVRAKGVAVPQQITQSKVCKP
jgi:type VI secretion system protein ImpL